MRGNTQCLGRTLEYEFDGSSGEFFLLGIIILISFICTV
jgi:hypothetical protein